uniref:PNPLA domain-containing protein n=1 Tax=Neobodo designis TaxID=312471 RepID=A0A7S1PQB8_NEODS|mmetsp:Transcript_15618/g.48367  ORF Transcript_15618/g.48367 Transcript_15618/m.48367 type:complete len:367 (+) Transcript_15618:29-1129(+)
MATTATDVPANVLQTGGASPQVRAVSFSGCGWLANYSIGASQALRDAGVIHGDARARYGATRCVGASGGALTAACAALDLDSRTCRSIINDMHRQVGESWLMHFRLDTLLDRGLPRLQREFEAAPSKWQRKYGDQSAVPKVWQDVARGRLGVHFGCLNTSYPFYHVAVRNDYASFFDVCETLTASCLVPGFAKLRHLSSTDKQAALDHVPGGLNRIPESVDTRLNPLAVDGGLIQLQPEAHEFNVLNVSPLWVSRFVPNWPVDVCPRYIPLTWMLFPPRDPATYDALFVFGYRDAMMFAERNGFVPASIAQDFLHQNGCSDPEIAALEPEPIPHMVRMVAGVTASGWFARRSWMWLRTVRRQRSRV